MLADGMFEAHRARFSVLVALGIVTAAGLGAETGLTLRGRVIPPLPIGIVEISAVNTSFHKAAYVHDSRFEFKHLEAGSYLITVFHPQWGATQRTYQVSEEFANEERRVEIAFLLLHSESERARHLRRRHTVSADELSVSPKAHGYYRKALKKLSQDREIAAEKHLQRAVEISPQFVGAWIQLGTIM